MRKKVIFLLLIFFLMFEVKAFDIDIDKISINAKSEAIINDLDASYKIETNDFDRKIVNDEQAVAIAKELVKLSMSSREESEKIKEYTTYMYMDNSNGSRTMSSVIFRDNFFRELKKYSFSDGYIRDIRTASFKEDEVVAFAYVADVLVNKKQQDVIMCFWFKRDGSGYKVFFPWITVGEKLTDYFNKLTNQETKGNVIGGSYNSISLSEGTSQVSEELLSNVFEKDKSKVVQITGMNDSGSNMYGSGFYLNEGVVVTTWSLFMKFLSNSNVIFVNDVYGNTYNVKGVITADVNYDVVVLKLDKHVGEPVTIAKQDTLKLDDKLFMINSRINSGFSINYGSLISTEKGRMKNLFAISSSDVGAALFNENGEMVGFNVDDQVNSELSYANSAEYLIELQELINKKVFDEINYTDLDSMKDRYYIKMNEESTYNNISSKKWDKYKEIGKVEEKITLDLIKASYVDDIVSLRYKNSSLAFESIYLLSDYTDELINEGFELVQSNPKKQVFRSNEYEVIIKYNMDYIIILMMER